jgi:hypothetical protein
MISKYTREECVHCGEPGPDYDEELCLMCWEKYTGEQFCRTVLNFQPMEEFWVWDKRIKEEEAENLRIKAFNQNQLLLPYIRGKGLELLINKHL